MTETDKKRHFTYHIKSQVQRFKAMFRSECGFQYQKLYSKRFHTHHILICLSYFSASLNSSSENSFWTFNSRGISIMAFLYFLMAINCISKEQFEVKMISIYLRVDLCQWSYGSYHIEYWMNCTKSKIQGPIFTTFLENEQSFFRENNLMHTECRIHFVYIRGNRCSVPVTSERQ